MSDAYKFVVIFTTSDGRVTHGLTNDPIRLLAMRVAEGLMSVKQAAASAVYAISPVAINSVALEAAVRFHRLVTVAMSNPEPIRKAILRGEMVPEQLEELRAELMSRVGGEEFGPPWPFNEERYEAPDNDEPT